MPGPEVDLKQQLFEAGNRLRKPPGSVDDLLALLDRVEKCLSFVEQQPPVEMQDALCPAFKALVINELLKHADTDVRVGVTACLTEIFRITAPDVPYSDELMKEVFRLTISAFEGLSDNSSKSFAKRVLILETVARVRSCAVLLDLECDGLVVDMFRNFYKCIRDFHTANVFASMENIMTLVVEEYDEISTDLLSSLLYVLKKDNKDALPVAKRLGEKVVQNCATKLKPYLVEAIKYLRINLLDYDFVVTLACQIAPNRNPLNENVIHVPSANGGKSAIKAVEEEVVLVEAAPSLTMSVPSTCIFENAAAEDQLNTSQKSLYDVVACRCETIKDQVQIGQGASKSDMVAVSLSKSEPISEKAAKKRGRKPKNAKDIVQIDSINLPQPDGNKESSELPMLKADMKMEVCNALPDYSMKPNLPEKEFDSSNQPLSVRPVENNAASLCSPSFSYSPPEKSSSETVNGGKSAIKTVEEEMVVAEAAPSLTMSIPSTCAFENAAAEDQLNTSHKLHYDVVACRSETIKDQVQIGQGESKSDMVAVSLSKSEPISEKAAKKRGRKPKIAKDIVQIDSSNLPRPDGNKESSELPILKAIMKMEVCKDDSVEVEPNVPETKFDSSNQSLSARPVENNAASLCSPSFSYSPPEKSSSETVRGSKKEISNQEAIPSLTNTEKKASDGRDDPETRFVSSEKDTPDGVVGSASNFVPLVEVKTQPIEGDSEGNRLKQSGLLLGILEGTPRTKKRGRPRKDAFISTAKGVEDRVPSEGASKKRTRLRFTLPENGEDLVGSRIKVWWPQDKAYYVGDVESFDPVTKRHKILYTDYETEILNLRKEKWKFLKIRVGFKKDGVTCTTADDASDMHDIKKSKTDSSSVGMLGNTDSPLKRGRGRPPKNYAALASNDSAIKGGKYEGETEADKGHTDAMADVGNQGKSIDSVAGCGDALSLIKSKHSVLPVNGGTQTKQDFTSKDAMVSVASIPSSRVDINGFTYMGSKAGYADASSLIAEKSKHNVLPVNGGTQTKQGFTYTDAMVSRTPIPVVRVDKIKNDPFTYTSDEEPDIKESMTHKDGFSDDNALEIVQSGSSAEEKTVGVNSKFSTSAIGMKRGKRKRRMCSFTDSHAVTGNTGLLAKRRPGRPSKLSLGISDEKSKYGTKQLGLEVSEPVLLENNATKSTPDSTRTGIKEDTVRAQNGSKSITGGVRLGSSTGLKLKFKTCGSEPNPNLQSKRSRKTTMPPSEQVNKDGVAKRPRGRPSRKYKFEALNHDGKPEWRNDPKAVGQHKAYDSAGAVEPDAEIIHKAEVCLGNSSGLIYKDGTININNVPKDHAPADVGMKVKQDSREIADNVHILYPNTGNHSATNETGSKNGFRCR